MERNEFVSNLIYELFKDKSFAETTYLKTIFKDLLGCAYEDKIVNECYVKIVNYQINKYGTSLCSPSCKRR